MSRTSRKTVSSFYHGQVAASAISTCVRLVRAGSWEPVDLASLALFQILVGEVTGVPEYVLFTNQ